MKSVVTHGVLLALVLGLALVTWVSPERTDAGPATVTVWDHNPAAVTTVSFDSDERTLLLERRANNGRDYLWARVTTRPPPPPPPDAADADADVAAETDADAQRATETTDEADAEASPDAEPLEPIEQAEQTDEFPVGNEGVNVVERLARLRALRDLGDATPERLEAFGLEDERPTVTVRLRNGTERQLALGNDVVGGGDRYVLDVERNRILVLPIGVIRPLEFSDMLRLNEYQTFEPDDVASVVVRARGSERTLERRTTGSPPQPVWSPPGSDQPDPAFAGFMEQVGQLWISRYVADVPDEQLETVLRIEYRNARGSDLGFLELLRSTETADQPAYFMRTARTIVLGEIYPQLGERLEQDVETLFRGGAGPSARGPAGRLAGD